MKRKRNLWIVHIKKVEKENPNMTYKDILKKAKLTYQPVSCSIISIGRSSRRPSKRKNKN